MPVFQPIFQMMQILGTYGPQPENVNCNIFSMKHIVFMWRLSQGQWKLRQSVTWQKQLDDLSVELEKNDWVQSFALIVNSLWQWNSVIDSAPPTVSEHSQYTNNNLMPFLNYSKEEIIFLNVQLQKTNTFLTWEWHKYDFFYNVLLSTTGLSKTVKHLGLKSNGCCFCKVCSLYVCIPPVTSSVYISLRKWFSTLYPHIRGPQ